MGRTLLLGHAGASWREWLKGNRHGRDLVLLDPADANFTVPGRLNLIKGDRVIESRFYGSLDAQRAPHMLIAGAIDLLGTASEDALVLLYAYRPTPLVRQLTLSLANMIRPECVLVATGTDFPANALPIGPDEVTLEASFPPVVQTAQRKAQWLKMLEGVQPHTVDLRGVTIDGTRLGCGRRLESLELLRLGFDGALWAEVSGRGLFVVTGCEPEDEQISRALDDLNCSRAYFTAPDAYEGMLCAFSRASGEDFGYGIVQRIDFEAGIAHILNSAEAPAPVRLLRLGSLRINERGSELQETRPWQV